jgi:multidrug transporter EmrE-like cation transporter
MNHGWLFLATALFAWVLLALVYQRAESRGANVFAMTASLGLTSLIINIAIALTLGGYQSADKSMVVWGMVSGFFCFVAIQLTMVAVTLGGLGSTWTIIQMSFALASLFTLIYPGSRIHASGLMGLVLSAFAVLLLGLDKFMVQLSRSAGSPSGSRRRRPLLWLLVTLLALLTNSVSAYGMTLGMHVANDHSFVQALAFVTSMAAMITLGGLVGTLITRRKENFTLGMIYGAGAGACSAAGTHSSLVALKFFPGFVMYPVTNGGSILLVALFSMLFFNERSSFVGLLGLVAGLIGITLLGLAA